MSPDQLRLMQIEFRPRPFNPDTDVRACFMAESDTGRILTQQIGVPGALKRQTAPACDPKGGLPSKLAKGRDQYQLTTDPRFVTCPKCQATKAFREAFAHQTGLIFDLEKINAGLPLDEVPEVSDEEQPPAE